MNSLEFSLHKGATEHQASASHGKNLWGRDGGEKGAAPISTHASLGPPWLRSKTCRGLRYHMKDWMILAPCEDKKDFSREQGVPVDRGKKAPGLEDKPR